MYRVIIMPDSPTRVCNRRPMISSIKLPSMAMANDQQERIMLICVCLYVSCIPA